MNDQLRGLPSVDRLLGDPRGRRLVAEFSRAYVIACCREVLDEARDGIRAGSGSWTADTGAILDRLESRLSRDRLPSLQRVINATGTILHTNLGRALLPRAAIEAVALAAANPVDLEYDVEAGERGRRETRIEAFLTALTGAEAATIVNNNAAAVLLALNTIASGKEVIVSRGELIEIGGAFRLPEIMTKNGGVLKEIGTTNRTHPGDYERAIDERTGLLLKVHASNYRIVGFSAEVPLQDLVGIGRRHGVPVMEDLGSGALVDLSRHGLPKEPLVADSVAQGADVVTFSGDKVLGGPQAGFIVGTSRWLKAIGSNPLHRALRCGKLTIAAAEAMLKIYQQSPDLVAAVPTLNAFVRPLDDIEAMGRQIVPMLAAALGPEYTIALEASVAEVGSGALPTEGLPSRAIALEHHNLPPDRIAQRFRTARPPIIGRISGGRFLLDLRAIFRPDDVIPHWPTEA